MPWAVSGESLLYDDDSCIVFQQQRFSSLCDGFVDNKLSIHFRQDKAKSVLFGTKHKFWNAKSLNIVYNGVEIKPHAKVKYLQCILDESLSDESMVLNIIDTVNPCLKFLHRQNPYMDFYVMHWYILFVIIPLHIDFQIFQWKQSSIKISGNWVVKSKLPPRSGCSLEAVEPHP